MKNRYIIILSVLLLSVSSCQFKDDSWVDFNDLLSADGSKFKVLSTRETDLSQSFPADCYLPDGSAVQELSSAEGSQRRMPALTVGEVADPLSDAGEAMARVSSVSIAGVMQELLRYGNQDHAIEVAGTYLSSDVEYEPIELSGKVILPKGRRPKRLILVSHYTIGSNAEAPSNCFSIEGVLVKMGYGLIIPDYIGYGVTADKVHPYLMMYTTAFNVIDMYLAVRDWLKAADWEPEQDDIYLMGYSQGGATTMAVEYVVEMAYSDPKDDDYIKIHRVFAGGGPYDVKATYERFVNTDTASYPVAVPLVIQGMIHGNDLNIKMTDLMQGWLYENLDSWINSKRYTTGQLNKLIGTNVTHNMLTKEAMDQTSSNVSELYKAMTSNSIISYNWTPQASVYIMHSMDDETVPYTNATNAKAKWHDANITYNFGHYGSHVQTFLRFVYSVQTLLEQEEKEMEIYK